jgi:MarR family transcriptional repressor of emrRAB
MSLSHANGVHSAIANIEPRKGSEKMTNRPSAAYGNPTSACLAIALVLRSCHLRLMDALRLALQSSDVTNSQYFLLCCFLSRPGCRANPSELADETGETRSNTTRICEAFFQRGWLQRIHNADDRRRVDMSLTQAGVSFTEALIAKVKEHTKPAEALLSTADYAETTRVLQRLAVALGSSQRD